MAVECELCESWEMEDERTFAFQLRQDVLWQNIEPVNGRNLTAEDIVFSYHRQRQQDWPNAPLLRAIRGLEAPQPHTLRISLAFADADFLLSLASGHSKIVASEAVESQGDLINGPTIGSGPWILIGTQPDGLHTFASNPDYFEDGLPFVDRLNINIITDSATRDAAFRVKNLDVRQMEPQEWELFKKSQPDVRFALIKEGGIGLEVALKASVPPFDDVRVRQAVFQAINPWKAIQDIWLGSAYVSLGFPPVEADWLLGDVELEGYFKNPQQARELLRQARPDAQVPVTIKVGDFGEAYAAHAQRIADELKAVGFRPTVELVNRRVFGEDVWLGGDYQMFVGPIAPITSPNGYLIPLLHSQGQWNTTEHSDEFLDSLIEAQAQEFDPLTRKELVLEIQRRALANALRFMPVTRISTWTWWPRVQNFHPNFAGFEYSHWARVWLEN